MKELKLFDFLNSINYMKKNYFRDESYFNDEVIKLYTPFIINKGLSLNIDTVLYANEANKMAGIDKQLQFEYLLGSVRPARRFPKWNKSVKNDDLMMVCEYFNYSISKAEQALYVLSEDDLVEIKNNMYKGGKK